MNQRSSTPTPRFMCNPDVLILFITKGIRLFSYGSLAVPLFMYLKQINLSEKDIGLLLSLIMVGDLVITMVLTLYADRIGRRQTLAFGALLKLLTGAVFSVSTDFSLLCFSGIIGVISMSGSEIGPFLSVEQSALSDLCEIYYGPNDAKIAEVFGWYNFVGYSCQAFGALFAGYSITFCQEIGISVIESHRFILYSYAFWGLAKFILYNELSEDVELSQQNKMQSEGEENFSSCLKRKQACKMMMILGALFALDSFAGGFIVNSFISFWFSKEWNIKESTIGTILMVCSIIGSIGGVMSSWLVKRYGAMETMLITHIPASLTIILIPMMPTQTLTIIMMIIRFSMGNMNISARQTYVTTLVRPDERSTAGGISNIARSFGLCFSPIFLGHLMNKPAHSIGFAMPFYLSGSIKLLYDLLIWVFYKNVQNKQALDTQERAKYKCLSDRDKETAEEN